MVDVEKIRQSLTDQLKLRNSDIEVFREQIESYCRFAKLEDELWNDIATKGRMIVVTAATSGKKVEKENPSVKQVVMVSKQKIDILRKLRFDVDSVISQNMNSDL